MTDLDRKAEALIQALIEQTMPLRESEKIKLARDGYTRFTQALEDRYGRNRVLIGTGRRNGTLYITAIRQDEKAKTIKSATFCLTGHKELDQPFLIESVPYLEKIFEGVEIDPETGIGAIQLENAVALERMIPANTRFKI